MVYADATVDLVVQAHLAIRFVLTSGKLDAIHAQVAMGRPGARWILSVDLGQRDEGPAVVWPALELRQIPDLDLSGEDRTARYAPRTRTQQREGYACVAQRAPPGGARISQ